MIYFAIFLAGVLTTAGLLLIGFLFKLQEWRRNVHALDAERKHVDSLRQNLNQQLEASRVAFDRQQTAFNHQQELFQQELKAFEERKIQYDQLLGENDLLKQDLFSFSVQNKKTLLDQSNLDQKQQEIQARAQELGERYLKDHVEWVAAKLTPNNFSSSKNRLIKVVEQCRSIGIEISNVESDELIADLQTRYEDVLRKEFERQEQARIKAQIRDEQRLERETQKIIEDAERERAAIEAALAAAMSEAADLHSAQIEQLREQLREAEENAARAVSQAQLTKSGHVYVISNIGSFGEGIYKIGMTRRLEPLDRVKELGDASVPFSFDVHMMISCDDAPALENGLHKELHKARMNRVNFRKEFFRTDIETIRAVVEQYHGEVDYVATPDAFEYRETVSMSEEDYDFIERAVESTVGVSSSDDDDD